MSSLHRLDAPMSFLIDDEKRRHRRGLLLKGHLCVAGMSTQSLSPFWHLVTCIMICISENPGRGHGRLQVYRFTS